MASASEREQVVEVLVAYATGIDSRDWGLFRTVFTDDCSVDYGDLGGWESAEAITEFMMRSHSGPSLHRLSNFAVTVEGDTATARSYVDAVVTGPQGRGTVRTLGFYDDQLVRVDGAWRIARRRFQCVRLRLPGPLGLLPTKAATRLAAYGARRFS